MKSVIKTANATRVEPVAPSFAPSPSETFELTTILSSVLKSARGLIPADAYAVWSLDRATGRWRIAACEGLSPDFAAQRLEGSAEEMPAVAICADDVLNDGSLRHRVAHYEREGIRSLMAVPLCIQEERRGALVFYFRTPHRFTSDEAQQATALASLSSSAVAATELYREQLEARARSDFLAEASAILASSMNYEETLAKVAELAIPHIADGCAVDLIEGNTLKRVAVAHPDPEQAARIWEVAGRNPVTLNPDRLLGRVVATRRSQLYRAVDDQLLRDNARSQEHLQVLRALNMLSALLVPLIYRGQVLGVITLGTNQAGRVLDEADVAVAEALASRAAVAIENARLFTALQESERNFRVVSETASCGIFIHDGRQVLYANKAAAGFIGLKPGDSQDIWSRVHPDDRSMVMQRAKARLAGEIGPGGYEFRVIGPDGRVVWLDLSASPIEYAGRKAILATAFDVTERRVAVEDLRNSRTQLRLIIDTIPGLVAYVDREQRFGRVNRTFEQWFQAPLMSFLGKSIREVVGEDNYRNLQPRIEQVLAGTEMQFEATNRYADATRHVLVSYVPDFDENREVRGFVSLVMDVTERRHAEEALRRTEKLAAAGRLAASIAHEINNPLESVTNLLYLLQQEAQLSAAGREYLSLAEQELQRVSQIATQTLRFHRQSTKPAPVQVEDVLDAVQALYHPRLSRLGATVEKRYRTTSPIMAFEGELRQLFANLIANALDAMTAPGRLMIRTRGVARPGGTSGVMITVADNGQGIPSQLRSRIFEPFVTSKATTGTGLGLWVSKEIVQKHGGWMRVRSRTGARSGSVFQVFLAATPVLSSNG